MTVKYIKLDAEHTQWDSALYSSKPRQIRRLTTEEARKQHWFPVKETFGVNPDTELHRNVVKSWEVVDGFVQITYEAELQSVERRRMVMINRVNRQVDRVLNGGITFNGVTLDTDEKSLQRVTGAVLRTLIDADYSTEWVTEDNTRITLEGAQIQELGKAFEAHQRKNILFGRDLKDSINSSEEPETFDISEGWPSTEYPEVPAE